MKPLLCALAALMAVMPAANAAPRPGAEDKAWIEKCTSPLAAGERQRLPPARVDCARMHENVENNEEMSQTELERSWPPLHPYCRKKAGWHRERHP